MQGNIKFLVLLFIVGFIIFFVYRFMKQRASFDRETATVIGYVIAVDPNYSKSQCLVRYAYEVDAQLYISDLYLPNDKSNMYKQGQTINVEYVVDKSSESRVIGKAKQDGYVIPNAIQDLME